MTDAELTEWLAATQAAIARLVTAVRKNEPQRDEARDELVQLTGEDE